MREVATTCLAGNHDLAVLGKVDVDRFGGDAARAARPALQAAAVRAASRRPSTESVELLAWAARLGGQELVTALVALVAAAFAGRGRWATGRFGTLALAASLAALGLLLPVAGTGSVAVAAVQGSVPRPALAPEQQRAVVLDNHLALTTGSQVGGARLVVWPEDVVAGDPLRDAAVRQRIDAAVAQVDRPVLVGGLVRDPGSSGPTNSSLLWLPRSGMVERYDKVHIVPFGEYLPMRDFLEKRIGRF